MSSLGYAAGGVGQGFAQGRQVMFDRQMKQREAGQRDTQLKQEATAEQNRVGVEQHAANAQTWQGLSAAEHDPNKNLMKNPDEIAGIHQKYMGFLAQHPEFDYANEVGAAQAKTAATAQAGNGESNDILTNPNSSGQMNPSVAGQPYAAPADPAANGSPNPIMAGQSASGVAGPPMPEQAAPPAPPVQVKQVPAGQSLAGNPHPYGDQQTNSLDGNTPAVGIGGSPDAASNSFTRNADYYDGQALDMTNGLKPAQRDAYRQLASSYRVAGGEASKTEAGAALLAKQGETLDATNPLAAKMAAAGLRLTTNQGTLAGNEAGQVAPNAQSQRAVQGEQVKSSQFQRGTVIPTQLKQGQQGLDLQASGQRIAAFTAHQNAAEAQKGMDLEFQKYGFSKQQFAITMKGMLAQAAHTQAEAHKLLTDPDFNSQAIIKTLADNAYLTSPAGVKTMTGPTAGAYQRYLEANQQGNGPTMINPSMGQILGTGSVAPPGSGGFDVAGLMGDKTLTAAQKAETLKRAGVTITPAMAKQLRGGS